MTREKETAQKIYAIVGPKDNIETVTHCMTRLRLHLVKDADLAELKAIPGVLGVNQNGDELQIVLGPGKVNRVADAFSALLDSAEAPTSKETKETPQAAAGLFGAQGKVGDGKALHEAIRQKNATPAKAFLRKVASIFMPLIPGFVGCGFLTGLLGIIKFYDSSLLALTPLRILLLAGSAIFQSMNILVGWNAAKVFGGTPVIGGILGALISHPGLAEISLYGGPLTPGRGGVIAVLLVTLLAAYGERKLRKIVPPAFDLFVTPTLVILVMSLLALYVLQPVGGVLAETIGRGASEAVERGGAVTGLFLGGLFLPFVMMGIHQGLTPIHAELINQFGYTILLPILAMAGAGQVGASLAVYVKSRNPRLKKIVASSLFVGMMGVGEPLIYGVTLPLGRPFVGACLGGAIGGAIQAAFHVGAFSLGISGLPLMPSTTHPLMYAAGLAAAYGGGFIATWLLGFEDPA